jgi:VIT1/CCC1 family predicted Fe2+/Mn2+ transporter
MARAPLLERWRSERTAAYLARVVAETEHDPFRRQLLQTMAAAAEAQAERLARNIGSTPRFRPGLRARLLAWVTRRLGPGKARPLLSAARVRGLSLYDAAPAPGGAERPPSRPRPDGRHRHRGTGGGALRAAVFGVNDGLVSNAALVMGVAGAEVDARIILLSGAAGLVAGAFSMAAGEYVSMSTQREMFEHQIAQEREDLEHFPEEEAEELAQIYHARGIDLGEARRFARHLLSDPAVALDTHAREELGLNPDDLGSPVRAALSSFAAFAAGAALPLLPFLFAVGAPVTIAAVLTGTALFAIGAALSLLSGRGVLAGGLRMLLLGSSAGAASYGIGAALGVAVG